jgi:hypothetical protein
MAGNKINTGELLQWSEQNCEMKIYSRGSEKFYFEFES